MKNLSTEHPIDKHLKPVKDSDGNNSSLEISTEKVRVKDLEVTGDTVGIETGTSITVDSSLTDGSTNPVENNAVFDGLATKLNLSGGTMTGSVDFGDQRISNLQRISFNDGSGFIAEVIDNDDMSSASSSKISTSESIKAYVDSSVDKVAGTILAYRDIGLNEAEASYNMTTSYAVPTDEFGITFTAPVGGNVEYVIENIWVDYGGSGAGDFFIGLSTANATSGYSALASYHEKNIGDNEGRYAQNVSSISWTLTGLTAGTDYTYYVGFKSSSTTGTPHISWGGDATGESPDIIIKAIALPASIST